MKHRTTPYEDMSHYKTVKSLEIKQGEFKKTSTMKIKRYKELKH